MDHENPTKALLEFYKSSKIKKIIQLINIVYASLFHNVDIGNWNSFCLNQKANQVYI